MRQTQVKFEKRRLANPRRGTSDRGWQGTGATLVALVGATKDNLLGLRIPRTKLHFLSLDTIGKMQL